uniref:BZIP domain-containing protein n=1 Tax=Rhabditophanes sp. KR3021 TaxID=114890 RepID=A0AC35U0E1_9BILA
MDEVVRLFGFDSEKGANNVSCIKKRNEDFKMRIIAKLDDYSEKEPNYDGSIGNDNGDLRRKLRLFSEAELKEIKNAKTKLTRGNNNLISQLKALEKELERNKNLLTKKENETSGVVERH